MTNSEPASGAPTPELSSVTRVTVEEKNTVGAMVPGMPYLAATPYLVGMAEMACSRLVKDLLEPGQVTVGSRVVIDHLGPSKVGAELVIKAALCSGNAIVQVFGPGRDGARIVAKVEHERAAVSLEKMMRALG